MKVKCRENFMIQPTRIQRKRTRGWKMPGNTIYVGRPTKWGNPFEIIINDRINRRHSVDVYQTYIIERCRMNKDFLKPLRGKNLACWCKDFDVCHADILLKLANEKDRSNN